MSTKASGVLKRFFAGALHAENLSSLRDVKVTMQCESHSVYNRSFWGEKTTEEMDRGSLFVLFCFALLLFNIYESLFDGN